MTENNQQPVIDENPDISSSEKLPIRGQLNVLRYRTIKKNAGFGWWSAVVLLEDHNKKQVCFYRWRKKAGEWKRDKKISFRKASDWQLFKESIDSFVAELD